MYIPNNINFRISSSSAIANFKKDQAFDFNEIANGNFKFHKVSKEILLLNYEIWFKFILRLEKLFVRNHIETEGITKELASHIITLADEAIGEIEDTMISHPVIFDSAARNIIKETHAIFIEYIFSTIKQRVNDLVPVAFTAIVNVISESLHNLLFQLHEYEALVKIKNNQSEDTIPFVSYTSTCKKVHEAIGQFPLEHRMQIYKKYFGSNKYIIKNYTTADKIHALCEKRMKDKGLEIEEIVNVSS